MRALAALVGLTVVVACTSTAESKDECVIAGTYTMTVTPETRLGRLQAAPWEQRPYATDRDDRDPRRRLRAPNARAQQAGAAETLVDRCKLQSHCRVEVTDAIDPTDNVGTMQFAWTFDQRGFTGINSGAFPRTKSLPDGCNFTSNATATRR